MNRRKGVPRQIHSWTPYTWWHDHTAIRTCTLCRIECRSVTLEAHVHHPDAGYKQVTMQGYQWRYGAGEWRMAWKVPPCPREAKP